MKNFINYYYNFDIYDIYFTNGKYLFYNEKNRYLLKKCNDTSVLSYYQNLNLELSQYQYFFTIVPNKEMNIITLIDNNPYVLLKLSNIQDEKISIFDIKTDFFVKNYEKMISLVYFPWITLWENKIDYFEKLFFLKQDSYKNIYPLFHYFIGISENAILYFKECIKEEKKEESDGLVISHKRMALNHSLYDYYDPTNIILDHSSRDVSEYIKSMFIHRVWDIDVVKRYLQQHYFSRYGIRIMFSRILFPSFFFDYIEGMIKNNQEFDLCYLELRLDEFQNFISEVSLFFKEEYNIPTIPWIIKKA